MGRRIGGGLLLALVVWGTSPQAANAGERVYGAEPMESQWRVSDDSVQCRLDHSIPQFGQATFLQPAGGSLRFELRSLRPQQAGEVALRAIPPEWRPGFSIVELGQTRLAPGESTLRINDQRAEWFLGELEEGVYPAIFYPEPAAGRGGVAVVLSGVRFRDALDEFMACRARLLNVDMAALRSRTLSFETNKATIGAEDRAALGQLARFAASGSPQRKVVIEAHADARGSHQFNERLSQRRAEAVRDFLLAQGVLREQIQVSALGERKPISDNRTDIGRARNRRASVRVVD